VTGAGAVSPPGEVPTDLTRRLGRLDTCAVSDALDSLGIEGVVRGIQCLTTRQAIAGSVVTVRLGPADREASSRAHLGTAAIEAATPGQIIVITNDAGTAAASWGGLLTLAATRAGVAGVIVDGAVRDVDEASDLTFPVFARMSVPTTARGRTVELSTNAPIDVCGIEVHAGDFAIADGTGVVIVPSARAAEVVDAAERIAAREAAIAAEISRGTPVSEAMGKNYEDMLGSIR
jgi:4-hydroxy-4-methyl-2-oxoglutarate aldolase